MPVVLWISDSLICVFVGGLTQRGCRCSGSKRCEQSRHQGVPGAPRHQGIAVQVRLEVHRYWHRTAPRTARVWKPYNIASLYSTIDFITWLFYLSLTSLTIVKSINCHTYQTNWDQPRSLSYQVNSDLMFVELTGPQLDSGVRLAPPSILLMRVFILQTIK